MFLYNKKMPNQDVREFKGGIFYFVKEDMQDEF